MKDAMAFFNGFGLTSAISAAVSPGDLRVHQALRDRGEATLRISAMFAPTGGLNPTLSLEEWELFFSRLGVASDFGDEWLSLSGVKLQVDGGMTLRTAAMRAGYPDDPGYRGTVVIPQERLNGFVSIANRYGWRVGIHAVGDAAVVQLSSVTAQTKMRIVVPLILFAMAIIGPDGAHAQFVDPVSALQQSRRDSIELDLRLARAASMQRDKENAAAAAVRAKDTAPLGPESAPKLGFPSGNPVPTLSVPQRTTAVQSVPEQSVAPPRGPVSATAAALLSDERVVIKISRSSQTMRVLVDGKPRYSWRVSTGRAGHETPAGTFSPTRLAREHYSREWDEAPMPHSIFFTGRGHAIHGSNDTRRLGHRASHGCVRLAPSDAATLFALVQARGLDSTKVTIAQ